VAATVAVGIVGREEDLRAAAALSPIADAHRRLVDPQSSLGHHRKAVRWRRARSQRSSLAGERARDDGATQHLTRRRLARLCSLVLARRPGEVRLG
jgi:hypothetical protein